MYRRQLFTFVAASLFSASAWSAGREVELVVPFPPGGGGDLLARSFADKFGEALSDTLYVLNKPGAGGNIGTRSVAVEKQKNPTVGYVTNGIFCTNPLLYQNMGFDPQKDLLPIGKYSHIGLVAVLNPTAIPGVTDLPSLIKYAKAHPGEVNFASAGIGTTSHAAGELFEKQTGTQLTHIPHKGGAAAIVEVLAGRIPFMIEVIPNVLTHIKAGNLKPLAVSTAQRNPHLPDIPTMKEAGIDGYELFAWDGLVAPKDTPQEELNRYISAFEKAVNAPEVKARLEKLGAELSPLYGEDFSHFVDEEKKKWAPLVKPVNN